LHVDLLQPAGGARHDRYRGIANQVADDDEFLRDGLAARGGDLHRQWAAESTASAPTAAAARGARRLPGCRLIIGRLRRLPVEHPGVVRGTGKQHDGPHDNDKLLHEIKTNPLLNSFVIRDC
jgi:hypothetical protein